MAGQETRADSPIDTGVVPGAELTDEQKEFHQKAKDAGWVERVVYDYAEAERVDGRDGEWFGQGKVYEWNPEEYGEVGPAIPELEKILFQSEHQQRRGEHLDALEFEVKIEGPSNDRISKFGDAGLHPVVMANIELAQYDKPTPIQQYTIPAVMQGYDVVAVAQTGSGKTAAYLIPIISKLMGKAKKLQAPRPNVASVRFDARIHGVKAEPLVVIVVPTRELAVQIFDEARRFCYRSMLRPCVAYGGLPTGVVKDQLGAGCDILVATPGRLCDLMDKPHILSLGRVKYTVIDEADEMLDQDWSDELAKIMGGGDTNEDADHVYLMFSATFPKGARILAREYMARDYVRIRVGRAGQAHKNIRQSVIYVDRDNKKDACFDLLFQSEPARTMIFCNAKPTVDLLDDFLYNRGLPTTSITGDRTQREREDAMRNFRVGAIPILIATGVSARGWDIKDVKHVINYDLPSNNYGGIREYIHRIGRTARIGHQGLATSFYNERDEDLGQDLVNVLVECDCEVPEFLQHLVPEDVGNIDFDDNSDNEGEAGEGFGAADGFGTANGFGEDAGGAAAAPGWGAEQTPADTGFQADAGFTAAEPVAAAAW